MPEIYRIQAQVSGEWKTQGTFEEDVSFSQVREQAELVTGSGNFGDVRILERIFDKAKDKSIYQLRWSDKSKAKSDLKVREDTKPAPPLVLRMKRGLSGEWVYLSKQQASHHPLYGVEGWLAYYSYLLIVSPLLTFFEFARADALLAISAVTQISIVSALSWYLYFLLIKKKQNFFFYTVILLTIVLSVELMSLLAVGLAGTSAVIRTSIELGYLLFSRRVNVTIMKRVRRKDLRLVLGPTQIDDVRFVKTTTQL